MRRAFANRVDTTATALIDEAKGYGALYLALNGLIDGVLLFRDLPPLLIDWKSPRKVHHRKKDTNGRTARQAKLVEAGWPIHFIENSEQLRTLLFGKAA